jgi:hypothetical protein
MQAYSTEENHKVGTRCGVEHYRWMPVNIVFTLVRYFVFLIMERIALQVPDNIAKAWRAYPAEKREQLEKEVEARIASGIRDDQKEEFFDLLQRVGDKAAKKGLTQELLDKLLREKE